MESIACFSGRKGAFTSNLGHFDLEKIRKMPTFPITMRVHLVCSCMLPRTDIEFSRLTINKSVAVEPDDPCEV